jgi:RimJ/RimL family protein N-acetyltransferase
MTGTYMRHVRPGDYSYLFGLLVDGGNGRRWRFGGTTPSPDTFERSLWTGVGAQFVAESKRGRLGHGAVFNLVLDASHAEVSIAINEDSHGQGALAAALGLGLLRHSFMTWPLDRVYARVPAYNLQNLKGLTRVGWVEEGQLTDYCFAYGRKWDEHILTLTRDGWSLLDGRFGRFALPLRVPDDDGEMI